MRAPVLASALLLLVAGCASAPGDPGPPTRDPDPAAVGVERLTDGLPVPAPTWGPCPDAPEPGFECARLPVPTDYRDPSSPPMLIAITRLRATEPDERRGALLSNPGGPGGAGRWNTHGLDQLSGGVLRRHFDLIGMDPRGTGASLPAARCGLTDELAAEAAREPDALDFDADLAESRAIAASCARTMGALVAHLGTVDVARDMDRLRAALGEERLFFSGVSYGTSLGTAYASMFPEHTGRVLLDSAEDDTVGWQQRFRDANPGFDARFTQVAEQIAADPRRDLGRPADIRTRYLDLRERATGGGVVVGATTLSVRSLRMVLEDAARNGGGAVDVLADLLAVTSGRPAGRDPAAVGAAVAAADDLGDVATLDQQVGASFGVGCLDSPWSRDVEDYRRAWAADRVAYPVSSGARATISPCAFWPVAPREPLPTLSDAGHEGTPQALIVHFRTDPATPLAGALRVREALGSRAAMITVEGGGHGVFGVSGCATGAAVAWLVDGEYPESDTTC